MHTRSQVIALVRRFFGLVLFNFIFYAYFLSSFDSWDDMYIGCRYWRLHNWLLDICFSSMQFVFVFSSFCSSWLLDEDGWSLYSFVGQYFLKPCFIGFYSIFGYFPLFEDHWLNHDMRLIWTWNRWFSFDSHFGDFIHLLCLNGLWKLCD